MPSASATKPQPGVSSGATATTAWCASSCSRTIRCSRSNSSGKTSPSSARASATTSAPRTILPCCDTTFLGTGPDVSASEHTSGDGRRAPLTVRLFLALKGCELTLGEVAELLIAHPILIFVLLMLRLHRLGIVLVLTTRGLSSRLCRSRARGKQTATAAGWGGRGSAAWGDVAPRRRSCDASP